MARPATKRQKRDHVPSDDEDDIASFASTDEGANGAGGAEGSDEDPEELESADTDDTGDISSAPGSKSKVAAQHKDNVSQRRKAQNPAIINDVSNANSSYKDNLFKLQVDELLDHVRLQRGVREEAAEKALYTVKKTMESLQPRAAKDVMLAERHLLQDEKTTVPFPDPRPPKDAKYKLGFAPPTNINVVGSYVSQTLLKSEEVIQIDMSVMMPASLYQEKDFLNHRYFYKRAYYLSCLAAGLKRAHAETYNIQYDYFRNNPLKPVVVISPIQAQMRNPTPKPSDDKWRIIILPCIDSEVFASAKLLPGKDNLRKEDASSTDCSHYNSSIRSDMLLGSYLKLLHGTSIRCKAFKDAALLGSVWLRQRGLSDGSFGAFEWKALMAVMLEAEGPGGRPILSDSYTSYQLFKAVLQLLALKDMGKQPLILGKEATDIKLNTSGAPILWDAKRSHNILYQVMPWTYRHLRSEARATLTVLGDSSADAFEPTFIQRVDLTSLRHDLTVAIAMDIISQSSNSSMQTQIGKCVEIYTVLERGLGDRVIMLDLQIPRIRCWPVGSARTQLASGDRLSIGFVINPETANKAVEHGPPAENKEEAAKFREFWGEKAELRRFRDGSILESVVWTGETSEPVLEQVIRYLVTRVLGQASSHDIALRGQGLLPLIPHINVTSAFQPATNAFNKLENDIRGLDDLPLSIRQLVPCDPQLRSTSIVTPLESFGVRQPSPMNVVLQFEGSARWPDELVAIQRTKIAFLLALSRALEEHVNGVSCRIGLENERYAALNQAYLDVIYDSGAAFRLRIHHGREQTLLERQLKDKTLKSDAVDMAVLGLAKYKRDYVRGPAQAQSIARLCTRFSAMSGTVRLLKKWFACHLLTQHFADELIELFAARTFLQPWPWSTPSSAQTGFLRTLHWFSRHDWKDEPLIVDFSGQGDLQQPERQTIRTRFEAWRKIDPGMNRMVIFAASNVDPDGTTWSEGNPSQVVVARAIALAKAACHEAESKHATFEPESLFGSPLDDYDFVLHLDKNVLTGTSEKTGERFKNLELAALDDDSRVGLDMQTEFLAELQHCFGSAILFFSGGRERPVIAGLWAPVTARRKWRVNLDYSTIPFKSTNSGEEIEAVVNKESMLAEMAHLGGDLIAKIQVNRH